MTVQRKYLRAADIAKVTGASIRTVRRWIADCTIPSVKLGSARLVAQAELERLLSPVTIAAETETNDDEE